MRAYREAMLRLAEASYSDVWYAHLDVEEVYRAFADRLTKKERKRGTKFVTKARSKNSLHAFDKLAEHSDGGVRIASQPPLIVPLRGSRTSRTPRPSPACTSSTADASSRGNA